MKILLVLSHSNREPWALGVSAVQNSTVTTVYGVRRNQATPSSSFEYYQLTGKQFMSIESSRRSATCGPGETAVSFLNTTCKPCPVGTFKSTLGTDKCLQCPHDTSTSREGATAASDCSVCEDNVCVHGLCQVDTDTFETTLAFVRRV